MPVRKTTRRGASVMTLSSERKIISTKDCLLHALLFISLHTKLGTNSFSVNFAMV